MQAVTDVIYFFRFCHVGLAVGQRLLNKRQHQFNAGSPTQSGVNGKAAV